MEPITFETLLVIAAAAVAISLTVATMMQHRPSERRIPVRPGDRR
jgi:hypothetical protein